VIRNAGGKSGFSHSRGKKRGAEDDQKVERAAQHAGINAHVAHLVSNKKPAACAHATGVNVRGEETN
jgi:hypothetical protein